MALGDACEVELERIRKEYRDTAQEQAGQTGMVRWSLCRPRSWRRSDDACRNRPGCSCPELSVTVPCFMSRGAALVVRQEKVRMNQAWYAEPKQKKEMLFQHGTSDESRNEVAYRAA